MKIYRIENTGSKAILHIEVFSTPTAIKFIADSLLSQRQITLSKKQWAKFKKGINDNCFWTITVDIKEDDDYLDGSSWIIEGFSEKNRIE